MIEMKNVAAGYGKNQVLHGVNLRAKQGKITTLIGSNGSGKSTLLHTMLKVIPLMDGDIMVDGMSIKSMAQPELARKIAYLPQCAGHIGREAGPSWEVSLFKLSQEVQKAGFPHRGRSDGKAGDFQFQR